MRYLLILIFFFNYNNAIAEDKLAIIDLNYIINNSISGKSINNFINDIKKKKIEDFKIIEKNIKKEEDDLLSNKNEIEKKKFNEKVEQIKLKIKSYKQNRQKFNKTIEEKETKYKNKLLKELNPIISNYVEKNSIAVVFPKNMIIIGKKSLDITLPILKLIDQKIQKIDFNE